MRADARRNRERLLFSADALFTADGPGVPLDDIARHAGVGPGTLHRHFPTKESLISAVVLDRVHAHAEHAAAQLDAPDPAAALVEVLRRLVTSGQREAPLKAVLAADGFDLRTAAPEASTALRTALAELLTRAQRGGTVRADLDVDDVLALLAGVFAAVRHAGDEPVRTDRLLTVFVDGLRALPLGPPR